MVLSGHHHRWADDDLVALGNIYGTAGNDYLTGTKSGENIFIDQGGEDTVIGRGGFDNIYLGDAFSSGDFIRSGNATVYFEGQYSDGIVLSNANFRSVDTFIFSGQFDYNIVIKSGIIGAGENLYIAQTNDVSAVYAFNVDATAVKHGYVSIGGGAGEDSLYGGGDNTHLHGAGGADYLVGGSGPTEFSYWALSESTPRNSDHIVNFKAGDKISLSAIDADPKTKYDQAFHFGATATHTGDLTVTYDGHGETIVSAFTGRDADPDFVIYLQGNHSDLTASDFFL